MSSSLELKKTDFDFKHLFKPLNDTFSSVLEDVISTYWNEKFGVKLYFLGEELKRFVYGTKFFVTQAQIQKIICDMRLSAQLCEMLLDKSLGEKEGIFKISEITNLEGEIIAKFSKILFDKFQEIFPSKDELKEMINNNIDFEEKINLGFVIFSDDENYEAGKFILSVPKNLLTKIPPVSIQENSIDVSCFTKSKGEIDILIGKTKLSLDDMRGLDIEDIVLLENSNIKMMKIVYPEILNINVNPDPRLFINDEQDNDSETAMEDMMSSVENIWDNVQVDVLAKFSKVKLSLGELRQMSEGAVVELDHVYDNTVVLEVEKKTVAKGELVIIGDKYGVRITETYANPTKAEEYAEEDEDEFDEEFEETDNEENEATDDFDVNDFEIDGKE